jgi:hypothetical protein
MSKPGRITENIIFLVIILLLSGTGCASAKKKYVQSKRQESLCDLSRLGKNKYFYSSYYKRKLSNSFKKYDKKLSY